MKKIFVFFILTSLVLGAFAADLSKYKLGEKVNKKFPDGSSRWVTIIGIEEYDDKGNKTHYKDSYSELWYEYDDKGNLTHIKSSKGDEWLYEYEYDDKGNKIHTKETNTYDNGYETWYDYDAKGHLIREIKGKPHKGYSIGYEIQYRSYWEYEYDAKSNITHKKSLFYDNESWYDSKGNLIHEKISNDERWCEYDDKGNLIYEKNYNRTYIDECWEKWYEYEYEIKGGVFSKKTDSYIRITYKTIL